MTQSSLEILSLLWVYVKQGQYIPSPVDEKTFQFFEKVKPLVPKKQALPRAEIPRAEVPVTPKPKPAPKTAAPVKEERQLPLPEELPEEPKKVTQKSDKLLPREVSFTTADTFQTRKTISANKAMPSLADGCLYQNPDVKERVWAVFSFPAAAQEAQFLQSVACAVQERLHRKITHFQCLDPSFLSNLTLSAHDADALFFFIEPHNETTLKKLLESHPDFSHNPLKEADPFLPLGSIHGKPLHLFFLTSSTTTSQEVKSRLWLALKKLAFSPG